MARAWLRLTPRACPMLPRAVRAYASDLARITHRADDAGIHQSHRSLLSSSAR